MSRSRAYGIIRGEFPGCRLGFGMSGRDSRVNASCLVPMVQDRRVHSGTNSSGFSWTCKPTWQKAGVNTSWCLLGCSIGEFGTLAAFQYFGVDPAVSVLTVTLPIVNGLATSVALETAILHKGSTNMPIPQAFRTAMGMSFISMVAMELAMEGTDYLLTGGCSMQLWTIPPMLLSGFLAPLPYNYWRLKRFGKSCH